MKFLDTLIDFRGISVKIMIIMKENRKVGEFYFTDKIKISAAFYSCEDAGILNYFYRVSNGAFCLQQVHFGDLYTWIYQVQEMEEFDVPDKQFEVPKTKGSPKSLSAPLSDLRCIGREIKIL